MELYSLNYKNKLQEMELIYCKQVLNVLVNHIGYDFSESEFYLRTLDSIATKQFNDINCRKDYQMNYVSDIPIYWNKIAATADKITRKHFKQ